MWVFVSGVIAPLLKYRLAIFFEEEFRPRGVHARPKRDEAAKGRHRHSDNGVRLHPILSSSKTTPLRTCIDLLLVGYRRPIINLLVHGHWFFEFGAYLETSFPPAASPAKTALLILKMLLGGKHLLLLVDGIQDSIVAVFLSMMKFVDPQLRSSLWLFIDKPSSARQRPLRVSRLQISGKSSEGDCDRGNAGRVHFPKHRRTAAQTTRAKETGTGLCDRHALKRDATCDVCAAAGSRNRVIIYKK
ncbi:hypothetical protein EVAR_94701_1 [Eumeta japonica]|uniref:Uncharacterized protein n=1 Tax=Eumeta variegata TaxID=151549 RepID=A0A4C1UVK2_EUMVA|nr:hypothetical protein EVAR_94701_1 [Eumeta japonica]